MKRIEIHAMQWSRMQDLCGVDPLGEADVACLLELREVLARHGRLGRFALHLVHKHFEVGTHEILVEYSDPAVREQRFRVEARDSATAREATPTTWALASGGPVISCVCAYRPGQGHLGRHHPA